ncbi:MAG: hypothetical protein GVY28_00125, partial [Alphaproteobacteria bacterium]|nr:hypothetical protein [Alphaproteobacteria bacterium]
MASGRPPASADELVAERQLRRAGQAALPADLQVHRLARPGDHAGQLQQIPALAQLGVRQGPADQDAVAFAGLQGDAHPALAAPGAAGEVQRHRGQPLAVDRQALAHGEALRLGRRGGEAAAGMQRQPAFDRRHLVGGQAVAQDGQHALGGLVLLAQLAQCRLQPHHPLGQRPPGLQQMVDQEAGQPVFQRARLALAGPTDRRGRGVRHLGPPPGQQRAEFGRALVRQGQRAQAFGRRQSDGCQFADARLVQPLETAALLGRAEDQHGDVIGKPHRAPDRLVRRGDHQRDAAAMQHGLGARRGLDGHLLRRGRGGRGL